jgi:phosphopantetheine adenylyltransferase
MSTLAIYPGSFDPPTIAHLAEFLSRPELLDQLRERLRQGGAG